jgi:hypothetical protein
MYDFQGPAGDDNTVRPRINIVRGSQATDSEGLTYSGATMDGIAAITGAPLTLAGWAIMDVPDSNFGTVVGVGARRTSVGDNNTRFRYELYYTNTVGLGARYTNGTGNSTRTVSFSNAGANGVTAGQLFHIAGTFGRTGGSGTPTNTSRIVLYIDGISEGALNGSTVRPELSSLVIADGGFNKTSVGCAMATNLTSPGGAENYWNGRIGEVGIWDTELTAEEIQSLAEGYRCDQVRPQNLKFYMPLAGNRQIVVGENMKASFESTTLETKPSPAQQHPNRLG